MASVMAVSFMVLGSILFSIALIIVCGKRKLYQRKECSRRDPHIPGQEANKVLKREIERRIARVAEIKTDPQLLHLDKKRVPNSEFPSHHFRMKTLDQMKYLETELQSGSHPPRSCKDSIRSYLINLAAGGGPLSGCEPRLIHELCDIYDHARHDPASYTANQFAYFHSLLCKILHCRRSHWKSGRLSPGFGGAPWRSSSDRDSAIDDSSDASGEDDNLLFASARHDHRSAPFTARPLPHAAPLLPSHGPSSETSL